MTNHDLALYFSYFRNALTILNDGHLFDEPDSIIFIRKFKYGLITIDV